MSHTFQEIIKVMAANTQIGVILSETHCKIASLFRNEINI